MANVSMKVVGLQGFGKKLRGMDGVLAREIEAELFEIGSQVEGEGKELVPVDFGQLRASGFTMTSRLRNLSPGASPSPDALRRVMRRRDEISVVTGFGGPATPYALAVHENPRAGKTGGVSPRGQRYRTWARVGQWKYLETPFKRMAGKVRARLQARIAKVLARRG